MIRSRQTVGLILDGHHLLIEYRDLIWFGQYKFYIMQGEGQSLYVVANASARTIKIHQLIMNPPQGLEVDHINGNGLDNRRSNLRIVTHQINQSNLPKHHGSSSKYYGVSFEKGRQRWLCQVRYKYKIKTIGRFDSEIEAAIAYNNSLISMGISEIKRMNSV